MLVPNLQITRPNSPTSLIRSRLQRQRTSSRGGAWTKTTLFRSGQQGPRRHAHRGLWANRLHVPVAKRGGSGINFHNGETGMDGTVPSTMSRSRRTVASWCRYKPEYYGMLLFTQAAQARWFPRPSHQRPVLHRVGHQDDGFTSVVLNNRNASSDVSATVDLGSAWVARARSICRGHLPAT